MKFTPFKMAFYGQDWNTTGAINMHSSNPEPFSWQELQTLTELEFQQVLRDVSLGYESTQGHLGVRQALCSSYYPSLDVGNIALTSGAQEGIFLIANSLIEAGDEVVTFTPCFQPLVSVFADAGAQVKQLALDAADNWSIPWDKLLQAVTVKTKLLVINFPHNPTGATISDSELNRLIELCRENDCWLFSDEVFRGLEHDNTRLPAVAEHYYKGISMGVMSKSMALPGIRLGWLATKNPQLIQQCLNVKSQISICQSSLDAAVTEKLLPASHLIWQRNNEIIHRNKALVSKWLTNNEGFHAVMSKASATLFVQCKEASESAETFCHNLLKDKGIFTMPSPAFLTDQQGFRLTLGKRNADSLYEAIFTI
ncbi:pyridoxal phosphate-dependent aminotransferase [Alteromonas sp. 5E99-2]|uniref:pyridoxal phosphate-dependent aminotransferase n=1 Tax=Alteromonas sp. 5E99-2 TaxID=2817683 RepID=UPI001A99957B|nr:pyridoxal phosphate-dependent aminotransferase [Alteromonas sp. 5E99-2]